MFKLFRPDPAHPFQLAKFLSLSSLLLILGSSLFLSVFMANYAREIILTKNKSFALLLAENLNHQVYQRFTLPTVLGFGRIELKQEAQYQRLEQVVTSTIHSFHVLEVRIYDADGAVSYATDKSLLGREDLSGVALQGAVTENTHSFDLISTLSNWEAMFQVTQEPETFVMRTTYPLRAERGLGMGDEPGPLMGVLEFSQDITEDYQTVIHFQWLIILVTFFSFSLLFVLLFMVIRRADRLFSERFKEKERLERDLLQNEKLASMGRMVASIAHEIRNPLGIIRSSAELLLKRARAEGSSRAALLEALFDESKRLSQTVNDFLDYARPRQPVRDEVDPVRVLERVVAFLGQEESMRAVRFECDYPDEPVIIFGDSDLLYRAFYNLISNSLQAMEGQGTLHLTIRSEADRVSVILRDSGPGFDLSMVGRYVEPFFTTKETGTGLGLAIVNTIFRSHGATMVLGNHEDGGAEVVVEFVK
ncbi:MAG TPA: ATP-binding protein [Desulfomicrobiaceae bacterium]|nr:ATP-binding protein [Desulfomicrobiaceae bacterium]